MNRGVNGYKCRYLCPRWLRQRVWVLRTHPTYLLYEYWTYLGTFHVPTQIYSGSRFYQLSLFSRPQSLYPGAQLLAYSFTPRAQFALSFIGGRTWAFPPLTRHFHLSRQPPPLHIHMKHGVSRLSNLVGISLHPYPSLVHTTVTESPKHPSPIHNTLRLLPFTCAGSLSFPVLVALTNSPQLGGPVYRSRSPSFCLGENKASLLFLLRFIACTGGQPLAPSPLPTLLPPSDPSSSSSSSSTPFHSHYTSVFLPSQTHLVSSLPSPTSLWITCRRPCLPRQSRGRSLPSSSTLLQIRSWPTRNPTDNRPTPWELPLMSPWIQNGGHRHLLCGMLPGPRPRPSWPSATFASSAAGGPSSSVANVASPSAKSALMPADWTVDTNSMPTMLIGINTTRETDG